MHAHMRYIKGWPSLCMEWPMAWPVGPTWLTYDLSKYLTRAISYELQSCQFRSSVRSGSAL